MINDLMNSLVGCSEQIAELKARAEKAEAACAEMRSVLLVINAAKRWAPIAPSGLIETEKDGPWVMVNHDAVLKALSSDCGKDWIKKDTAKPLADAVRMFCEWCKTPSGTVTPDVIGAQFEALAIARAMGLLEEKP